MPSVDKDSTANVPTSPVHVMYSSLATEEVKPRKKRKTASWEKGNCVICGMRDTDCLPAGALLGATFGSWQELVRSDMPTLLCKACAWAFKDKQLLRQAVWVDGDEVERLEWKELAERLARTPVSSNVAIVAPHGGRKIVAPYAKYGFISADGGLFPWKPEYRKALQVCFQLDRVGIRGSLLSSSRVPSRQVSSIPEEKQRVVYEMWDYLSFIRDDKTLLGFFTKLSMNIGGKSQ